MPKKYTPKQLAKRFLRGGPQTWRGAADELERAVRARKARARELLLPLPEDLERERHQRAEKILLLDAVRWGDEEALAAQWESSDRLEFLALCRAAEDAEVVMPYFDAALGSSDPYLRERAVRSLSRLAQAKKVAVQVVVDASGKFLKVTAPEDARLASLQRAAVQALIELYDAGRLERGPVEDACLLMLERGGDHAEEALGLWRHKAILSLEHARVAALRSGEPDQRSVWARLTLHDALRREDAKRLAELFDAEDGALLQGAKLALGHVKKLEGRWHFGATLPSLRARAAFADEIARRFRREDHHPRIAIDESSWREYVSEHSPEALCARVFDEDSKVRVEAVRTLGLAALGANDVRDASVPLLFALHDPDPDVRMSAEKSLASAFDMHAGGRTTFRTAALLVDAFSAPDAAGRDVDPELMSTLRNLRGAPIPGLVVKVRT
ncbi:MAG: hypothetical protein AAF411_11225 [Myxococcota bacterium]